MMRRHVGWQERCVFIRTLFLRNRFSLVLRIACPYFVGNFGKHENGGNFMMPGLK